MGATTLGNGVTVVTGVGVTTLPAASPVTITSSGSHSDSYWTLSGTKLIPDTLTNKVGLGTVDTDTFTDNHFLLYDATTNEIKKIYNTAVAEASHTQAWSTITSTPTTLANYGITDSLQPLDADLTAIAALGFTSTSFLKKTAANTWALDTNTYSTSAHTHAYEPVLGNPSVDDYVLSSKTDGTRSWVAQVEVVGAASDHGLLTGLGDDDHTQYAKLLGRNSDVLKIDNIDEYTSSAGVTITKPTFTTSYGFATDKWRQVLSTNDMLFSYNSGTKVTFASDGTATFAGNVIAYG